MVHSVITFLVSFYMDYYGVVTWMNEGWQIKCPLTTTEFELWKYFCPVIFGPCAAHICANLSFLQLRVSYIPFKRFRHLSHNWLSSENRPNLAKLLLYNGEVHQSGTNIIETRTRSGTSFKLFKTMCRNKIEKLLKGSVFVAIRVRVSKAQLHMQKCPYFRPLMWFPSIVNHTFEI